MEPAGVLDMPRSAQWVQTKILITEVIKLSPGLLERAREVNHIVLARLQLQELYPRSRSGYSIRHFLSCKNPGACSTCITKQLLNFSQKGGCI